MVLSSDPKDVPAALWFFGLSALWAAGRAGHWLVTDPSPPLPKPLLAALLFGCIGALWIISHSWASSKLAPNTSTMSAQGLAKTVNNAARPSSPEAVPSKHFPKTTSGKLINLRDLFFSDFDTTVRCHSDVTMLVDGVNVTLIAQAYFDFNAKSVFIGFFIPSSVRNTYQVCSYLSTLDHAGSIKHMGVKTSGGSPGQMTDQDDLVFTGRIYIYHEEDLSIEQRAMIIKLYRARNLDVQFRGSDYLVLRSLSASNPTGERVSPK